MGKNDILHLIASIGNPHCVIPMQEISEPLVCKIGRESERARYFPNHINTELMNVIDMNNIAIETYERGAGYTMANGTGACAAAGVAYKLGLTNSKVIVHMPGGELQVRNRRGRRSSYDRRCGVCGDYYPGI